MSIGLKANSVSDNGSSFHSLDCKTPRIVPLLCVTAMTLRMYANKENLDIEEMKVHVTHSKGYGDDVGNSLCEIVNSGLITILLF